MKKINFILILFTFIFGITTFFYMDVLSELMLRSDAYIGSRRVTKFNILSIFLLSSVWAILPSWLLGYMYTKLPKNKSWFIFIILIYSIVWMAISFFLMSEYSQFYGATWQKSEILFYTISQDHFLLVYVLSFIPLIVLGIWNKSKKDVEDFSLHTSKLKYK